MNFQAENPLLTKLKQTIIQKEEEHKFSQIMSTNIRLNKNDRLTRAQISSVNSLLPSISNAKANLTQRMKSQSAKRLVFKPQQEKGSNNKSTKKISQEIAGRNQHESINKIDLDGILMRKQSVLQNSNQKQVLRSKVFSLKTPLKEDKRKEAPTTKDISMKNQSNNKTDRQRQTALKQFTTKIQNLNEQLVLTIKLGRINPDSLDNKKIMAYIGKLSPDQSSKATMTLEKLTRFISRFKIQNGSVDFKGLLKLSTKKVLSNHDLICLFFDKSQLIKRHKIIGQQYYTPKEVIGQNLAATRIISLFKMIFSKRFYIKFKALTSRVKIIQRHWRNALLIRIRRRKMLGAITAKIERHNILQEQLCKKWGMIKTSKRYEVHICSYSLQEFKRLTIKNLRHRENNQITRIFKAIETDVNIIYVTPLQLHSEVIKYYHSIFTFNSNIQEKVYFVVPENSQRFEKYGYLTTTALLLYSPKAIKRIRQIVGSDFAYIVPSYPSIEYVNLSAELNMPILGCNQNNAKLYSTKSGSLKLFTPVSEKEKPPFRLLKSVKSIFSQKELINSLAILIHKNHHIKQWYLKIEDEIQSRGLAYLNINKINFLRQLCCGEALLEGVEQAQIIALIAEELTTKLKSRIKIINKDIYANYDQYISHFLTRGGIIEAAVEADKATQFSISFFIDPTGQFAIVGTYNKLQLGGKSISQSIKFPSSLSSEDVDYEGITRNLYKQFWVKLKLWGYFTVDFIHSSAEQLPYAIGLDCFLNQKTASIFMVNFCCGTRYDKDNNALINSKSSQLHYVYCPSMSLYNPPATNPFFKSCKFQNISYDLEKKVGTIFVLLDRIQSEQIGYLCIEENVGQLLKELKRMVEHFCKVYRQSKNSHDQIGLMKGLVTIWLKKTQKQKQGYLKIDNQLI